MVNVGAVETKPVISISHDHAHKACRNFYKVNWQIFSQNHSAAYHGTGPLPDKTAPS